MKRRELIALPAALAAAPAPPAQQPAFQLPKLPYSADALEPHLDAQTMEIHHARHHQAYVNNLNQALSAQPALGASSIESLLAKLDTLPASIRTAVRNNGGGHANHSLFWQVLGKPGAGPGGALLKAIERSFQTQGQFEGALRTAGLSVFGSGWVWVVPAEGGKLSIETSPNQDSPWLRGQTPLLGIDVWEHAYYLKYQNRRADYLSAVLRVLNWEFLAARYESLSA